MTNIQFRLLICFVVSCLYSAPFAAQASQTTATAADTGAATSETQPNWGLDGALLKSFSGENALSSSRLTARRLVNSAVSLGMDLRHWNAGSYPLALDADAGVWAGGATGQFDLFRGRYLGAHVGASFLWVPGPGQFAFAPEAGFRWYVSRRIALGLSYSVLTDLSASIISFDPPATGRSRQSLGLSLSVYL